MKGIDISDANKNPIDAAENHPQALLAAPCGGTSGHIRISGYQHAQDDSEAAQHLSQSKWQT